MRDRLKCWPENYSSAKNALTGGSRQTDAEPQPGFQPEPSSDTTLIALVSGTPTPEKKKTQRKKRLLNDRKSRSAIELKTF